MRRFKGYVSPSREGILSDRPESSEYDRVDKAHAIKASYLQDYSAASSDHASDIVLSDIPALSLSSPNQPEGSLQGAAEPLGFPGPEGSTGDEPSLKPSFFAGFKGVFKGKVLAMTLAVNAVLILFFALIMSLDKPVVPTFVYYINLVSSPAGAPAHSPAQNPAQDAGQK